MSTRHATVAGREIPESADFIAYAKRRDARARERLVRAYLPLAVSIARRYHRDRRVALDDLKQVAAIGLLKAIERFDPDRAIAFTSFAVPTIDGELKRYLRDYTWAVRPPRGLQERAQRVCRERDQLSNDLGRSPTAHELAERMGCSLEAVVEASEAAQARAAESFDLRAVERHDMPFAPAERIGAEDGGFAAAEASVIAERLLSSLSDRERRAIHLRFHHDLTQAEIARRIGCSQMHVSRILRRALARLAEEAASDGGCSLLRSLGHSQP
ncbi:MAG TPA: SigB/SigF/SigG family RNA polymerase sigma factor [Solirubrobacteraceae bacterium]|nr:SigB/SigF/SigG family RNA polymerase sigma factor [Solirubrobacteraceae bacterium]